MTAIDVAEMTGWTRALQQRQRGWMQRATVSTAAAIIFSPVLGFEQTLPWLIAFVIAQGLEHLALSAAAKGREVTCGGALYSTLHSVGSMRALLATAGPQYLYLCLGAWFMTRVGAPAPFVVATLICGVTFSIYCLWTWRTMNDVYRSETAARLDSQQRREEAERRMGAQSAFLAAVGHDLRTPISAILTGAAKLDAGRMTVEREPMELRRLLCQTARFWRPAVAGKGLRLRIDAGRETPEWIVGDAMRLRQILNNLISNALKFTDRGHLAIRVRSWAEDDGRLALLIDIEDSGPGMTPQQVARLFTAFDQTDQGAESDQGGRAPTFRCSARS